MQTMVQEKDGWIYGWRRAGIQGADNYTAFFANARVGTNILYSYDALAMLISDPVAETKIPRGIIAEMVEGYPPRLAKELLSVAA